MSIIAPFFSLRLGTCTALTCLVFACRCWLIAGWGSPVPFWDQWGVESSLYRAWLTDSLRWSDVFAAHNEHRIPLTKLADLALFVTCSGWNPWMQQLLNAALHAATAGVLAAAFWNTLSRRTRAIFIIGVALLFCSTAGWQNALWGFQSGVYFSSLFAVLAFVGLTFLHRRGGTLAGGSMEAHASTIDSYQEWRVCWFLAFMALILALLSNAGGVIAVIVALGLAWPRMRTSRAWLAWLAIAGLLAAGIALRVDAPQHAPLHARSVEQFWAVFARGLGWPHVNSAWAWLGMQLPLVWLCLRRWKSPSDARLTPPERCACALAAFATLQAAAVAYTRGAGLPEFRPLSRYQDPLILGAVAQLYAAVRLAVEAGRPGRLVLLGWSSLALMGLISLTTNQLSLNLPYKRAQDGESLAQIRTYLKTSDASIFTRGASVGGPDSNATEIARVLTDPVLRPVLPREFHNDVRPPWLIAHSRLLVLITCSIFGAALVTSFYGKNPNFASAPRKDD